MACHSLIARCGLLIALLASPLAGCGSDPDPVCVPGASVACVGEGGCAGGQVCNPAGSGFTPCACGSLPDAGPRDAGDIDAGPTDAGEMDSGPLDMSLDAEAADMNVVDGGPPGECNPISHAGCGSGERCTWVISSSTPVRIGSLRCVPDGTVASGGACTVGPDGETSGYDDCARGLICTRSGTSRTCASVCDLADSSSCGGSASCVRYQGLFANGGDDPVAGACASSCDPVTQLRDDGTSCGAGLGCYALIATAMPSFVCGAAESTLVHGEVITGGPSANACAPGFHVVRSAVGSGFECAAYCRPVETHAAAVAGAAGAPPYSCPDRGAASPANECLFASLFASSDAADPRIDTIGICYDRSGRTYDSNGDGTPDAALPSCTTLSNTDTNGDGIADNAYFGCAPRPAAP